MNGTGNLQDISADAVPVKKFPDHSRTGWGSYLLCPQGGKVKIRHTGAPKQPFLPAVKT